MVPMGVGNEYLGVDRFPLLSQQPVAQVFDAAATVEDKKLLTREFKCHAGCVAAVFEPVFSRYGQGPAHTPEPHVDMVVQDAVDLLGEGFRINRFTDVSVGAEFKGPFLVEFISLGGNDDELGFLEAFMFSHLLT